MSDPIVRDLGRRPLEEVWADMQRFTDARNAATPDEIWFLEHWPVFTLGLAADPAHVLAPADIEVVKIDRGGQVTYHGPGQLVCYTLLDVKRRNLSIRQLIETLESAVVETVAAYGIAASGRRDAPGVYVEGAKLAAIGLRIRRGCSYHGIAVNLDMDLEPYSRIHPCGFDDLKVTQLSELTSAEHVASFRDDFAAQLLARLAA